MKTYRINKYAERLAQGTGFAPELIYNISLVRFQGRNGRCIAAWTPGIKRPRYVYKVHTPEEYDKAMERIRQEAERFRRHDEAQEKAAAAFRESLRVGDILYSSWGWEQTNIDFYQVVAIRGSAVDLRQLDQRTTEDGYMCGTTVPLPDVSRARPIRTASKGVNQVVIRFTPNFAPKNQETIISFLILLLGSSSPNRSLFYRTNKVALHPFWVAELTSM